LATPASHLAFSTKPRSAHPPPPPVPASKVPSLSKRKARRDVPDRDLGVKHQTTVRGCLVQLGWLIQASLGLSGLDVFDANHLLFLPLPPNVSLHHRFRLLRCRRIHGALEGDEQSSRNARPAHQHPPLMKDSPLRPTIESRPSFALDVRQLATTRSPCSCSLAGRYLRSVPGSGRVRAPTTGSSTTCPVHFTGKASPSTVWPAECLLPFPFRSSIHHVPTTTSFDGQRLLPLFRATHTHALPPARTHTHPSPRCRRCCSSSSAGRPLAHARPHTLSSSSETFPSTYIVTSSTVIKRARARDPGLLDHHHLPPTFSPPFRHHCREFVSRSLSSTVYIRLRRCTCVVIPSSNLQTTLTVTDSIANDTIFRHNHHRPGQTSTPIA
jgi:hypothetical protein